MGCDARKKCQFTLKSDSTPFKSDNSPVKSRFGRGISVIYDIVRRKSDSLPYKSDNLPFESDS
jgi:hypothetical protein